MKLFKKDSISQRIYKYVDDFQRGVQNNNYQAARDAVEKALKIDPDNKGLLDMNQTVMELVEMQNSRDRPALSDVTHVITEGKGSNAHPSADECESVEAIL